MRAKTPMFSSGTIEAIARKIGDAYTGGQITSLLFDSGCGKFDPGTPGTKWVRVAEAIERHQRHQGDGHPLLVVARSSVEPGRLLSSNYQDVAARLRDNLNAVLSTEGYALGEDGRIRRITKKFSYEEAQRKAQSLSEHLSKRGSHEEVLKHCRDTLLQHEDDYYEVVFEAAKGLEERIRRISGSNLDGRRLAQNVLSKSNRLVPINSGKNSTEQNEQESIRLFTEGIIAGFRNPPAHNSRLNWRVSEQDAQDVLGLLALIHRRLDAAEKMLRSGASDSLR